jgi:hypothetical protein
MHDCPELTSRLLAQVAPANSTSASANTIVRVGSAELENHLLEFGSSALCQGGPSWLRTGESGGGNSSEPDHIADPVPGDE